jgi:hypothetical protein
MLKMKRIFDPNAIRAWRIAQEAEDNKILDKLRAGGFPVDTENPYIKDLLDNLSVKVKSPNPLYLDIERSGDVMHFSQGLLDRCIADGTLSISNGKLTFKTADGIPDLVYTIISPPGMFCCHCGESMSDGSAARRHIINSHAGKASPDMNNPSGYRQDNFFLCLKDKEVC